MVVDAQVLVVGAGPTGLLLAGDLARAGVSCLLVERRAEESNLTRAFAVHARTLEILDARGVADELVATGQRVDRLQVFGGLRLDLRDLPTRFPYVLVTPQYETERVLLRRAGSLGVRVLRGTEVTGLRQGPDGVEVDVRTADGTGTLRAAYLVGADGVRSVVRRCLGLDFPGRSVLSSLMLADVRLAEPPADVLTVGGNGAGFAFVVPFGDGWYRVIAWDRARPSTPDSVPVELADVGRTVRAVLGTDLGPHDARFLSRFHSDERQVATYRLGRVFLAGDAAHVHSPAGGQGMNTGLQDAANLGWKLAAGLRGDGPPDLLDSYQTERHPVGRLVLRASGALIRAAVLGPPAARAARDVLARLAVRIPPVRHRMVGTVTGLAVRYPAPAGQHRLVGTRAPDVELTGPGPRRLHEALRGGRFVLLTPADDTPPATAAAARVEVVTPVATRPGTILVRPDGYVGWAYDGPGGQPRRAATEAALTRWCGRTGGPVPTV
jgi:2-polyprenyl-6-methoxyphenol hydroxylase-like FAD-dependent oxidoreductase